MSESSGSQCRAKTTRVISQGCVSDDVFVREKEGGRQTDDTQDTHGRLVTVPLQGPVPVPETLTSLSIPYTPSLGPTRKIPLAALSPHLLWDSK